MMIMTIKNNKKIKSTDKRCAVYKYLKKQRGRNISINIPKKQTSNTLYVCVCTTLSLFFCLH